MNIVSKGGREIKLKELFNKSVKSALTLQVFIKQFDVLYDCYKVMSIQDIEGEIIIYNRLPGKVIEVFVQPGSIVTSESVLFNLEMFSLMEIEHKTKQNFRPPKMNVRFNIIIKAEEEPNSQWHKIVGHQKDKFIVLLQNGKTTMIDFDVMQKDNPLFMIEYLEKL